MNADKAAEISYSVGGLITRDECEFLFNHAKNSKEGVIVEIGNWLGRSTVALALGSKKENWSKVYSIDPHIYDKDESLKGYELREEFLSNLLELNLFDTVYPIELPSNVPAGNWNEKISLLWIDGDHSYEGCRSDVENWFPHVQEGGTILMHDFNYERFDVRRVVEEVMKSDGYKEVDRLDHTIAFRKENDQKVF